MLKKFFSVVLLATAMIVSSISAEALRLVNASQGSISDIKVVFSTSMFETTSTISNIGLDANQTGTSDFEDSVEFIKIYTVTYTDANGVEITKDFDGQKFFLPANLTLGDMPAEPVNFVHNEEAAKAAEEAELLNRAKVAVIAAKDSVVDASVKAKDAVVDAAVATKNAVVDAKDWVVEKVTGEAKEIAEQAQEAVVTVEEKAQPVVDTIVEEVTDAAEQAKETVQEVVASVEEVLS